jgi:DNA-binding response OmpR family regulator
MPSVIPSEARTVMVVEPDVLVRLVIAEYLRDCGYKVIEAVGSSEVWAVLDGGHTVDVLLVEVTLPGDENGFELAHRIRQTRREVDVILTSGIAGSVQQSHELCEEGPLKKPYDPKDVEARIKILLERRRAAKKT